MDISNEIAEMIAQAPNWNFQGDCSLLELMKRMSQNMQECATHTLDALGNLDLSIKRTEIEISNVNNNLRSLQFGKQFVEYRVQDEDETLANPLDMPEIPVEEPHQTKEEMLRTFLENNMKMLRKNYEQCSIEVPDSDDDEDDATTTTFIYRLKDPFDKRRLPYCIGTKEWHEKWHIGLLDSSNENSSEEFSESTSSPSSIDEIDENDHIMEEASYESANATNLSDWASCTSFANDKVQNVQNPVSIIGSEPLFMNTNVEIKQNKNAATMSAVKVEHSTSSDSSSSVLERKPMQRYTKINTKHSNQHQHNIFASLRQTPPSDDIPSISSSASISEVLKKPLMHQDFNNSDIVKSNTIQEAHKLFKNDAADEQDDFNNKPANRNQIKRKPVNLFDDDDFNSFITEITDKAQAKANEENQVTKTNTHINIQSQLTNKHVPKFPIDLFPNSDHSPNDVLPIPPNESKRGSPTKKQANIFDDNDDKERLPASPVFKPAGKKITAESLFEINPDGDDDFLDIFGNSAKKIDNFLTEKTKNAGKENESKINTGRISLFDDDDDDNKDIVDVSAKKPSEEQKSKNKTFIKTSLFEDDGDNSDTDLFGNKKSVDNENPKMKSTSIPQTAQVKKNTFFDDDDDDLFGTTSVRVENNNPIQSTETTDTTMKENSERNTLDAVHVKNGDLSAIVESKKPEEKIMKTVEVKDRNKSAFSTETSQIKHIDLFSELSTLEPKQKALDAQIYSQDLFEDVYAPESSPKFISNTQIQDKDRDLLNELSCQKSSDKPLEQFNAFSMPSLFSESETIKNAQMTQQTGPGYKQTSQFFATNLFSGIDAQSTEPQVYEKATIQAKESFTDNDIKKPTTNIMEDDNFNATPIPEREKLPNKKKNIEEGKQQTLDEQTILRETEENTPKLFETNEFHQVFGTNVMITDEISETVDYMNNELTSKISIEGVSNTTKLMTNSSSQKYGNIFLDEPPDDVEFFENLSNTVLNSSKLYEDFDELALPDTSSINNLSDVTQSKIDYSGLHLFSEIPPDDDEVGGSGGKLQADTISRMEAIATGTKRLHTIFYDDFSETATAGPVAVSTQLVSPFNEEPKFDVNADMIDRSASTHKNNEDIEKNSAKKIKMPNININVQALLPGLSAGVIPELKATATNAQNDATSSISGDKHNNTTIETVTSNEQLLGGIYKTRVRAPANRRPSTRRARQENYRKSQLAEDAENKIQYTEAIQIEKKVATVSDFVADADEDVLFKPVQLPNTTVSIAQTHNIIKLASNNDDNNEQMLERTAASGATLVKKSTIKLFSDSETDENDADDLFASNSKSTKPNQSTIAIPKNTTIKTSLFSDDEDDFLQSLKRTPVTSKTIVKATNVNKSLFSDVDSNESDDDLFGAAAKTSKTYKQHSNKTSDRIQRKQSMEQQNSRTKLNVTTISANDNPLADLLDT